jgi:hypothetical protein
VTYPSSPNFSKHSENLRAVQRALKQVERAHKRAIRDGDRPSEVAMRKVHTLLVGMFAEAQLRKIVDDPTGFNARERELIWLHRSQDQRWTAAVNYAARRHYGVLVHQSLHEVLPITELDRVERVLGFLSGELAPVITDRNRLAHGQWVWQLKSGSDDQFVSEPFSRDYNYVAIKARHDMLKNIARLVHVLCVSEPTFARDFEDLMKRIDASRPRLGGNGFDAFSAELKYRRRTATVHKTDRQSSHHLSDHFVESRPLT